MYFSSLSSTNHRRPIYRASGIAQYFIAYCVAVGCRWRVPRLCFSAAPMYSGSAGFQSSGRGSGRRYPPPPLKQCLLCRGHALLWHIVSQKNVSIQAVRGRENTTRDHQWGPLGVSSGDLHTTFKALSRKERQGTLDDVGLSSYCGLIVHPLHRRSLATAPKPPRPPQP